MRRLLLPLLFSGVGLAQVVTLPNSSGAAFRAGTNANFAWLNANKAAQYHVHLIADITGLQTALDGKVGTSDSRLTDARTPLSHVHLIADITGLQTALDGKSATSHNHAGVYEPIDTTILRQANLAGSGSAVTPAKSDHNHTGTYEPAAGNPGTTGWVWSSTSAGVRSWVANGSGSGYTGCTADGSNGILCTGIMTASEFHAPSGTAFSASGATQTAPTVSVPTLYFDATVNLPQYRNASSAMVGTMVAPSSYCTGGQVADGYLATGLPHCVAGGGGSNAVKTVVTYSATPTFTVSTSSIQTFTITLTGNVTSSTLATTNATAGQLIVFAITQDSTVRTFAWPSNVLNACAISTTASTVTTVTTVWDGSNANAVGCATTETPTIMSGPTRTAPATPAAGTVAEWYDSTSNRPMAKDSSGNVYGMVPTGVACMQATFNSPGSGNVLYGPPLPVASTVVGWGITAVGGSSPTATFDVWVIASGSALPTISNTIAASAKPALSTGNIARGSTLTGWTTALGQYASPAVHIDSISGAPTQINLTVYCTR